MELTACFLFYVVMNENGSSEFSQKAISNIEDVAKTFKKSKCPNSNTQKESNIIT